MQHTRTALAAGLMAALSFKAASAGDDIIPYRCPEPADVSITEQWKASLARATLIDNGGSKARIERGKTYAAFMDVLWRELETKQQDGSIETVGDMLNAVQNAYLTAYAEKAKPVLDKGVTPVLEFRNGLRGNPSTSYIHINPETLKSADLIDIPEIRRLLARTPGQSLDHGFDIGIGFQPSQGGAITFTLGQGLAANTDVKLETPIEQLLGFYERDDRYFEKSYWDEVNLKDQLICDKFR